MFKPNTKTFSGKNVLTNLPFDQLGPECREEPDYYQSVVDQFAQDYGIKSKSWVYPQAIAHVAKWTLSRNESEKYSPVQMLQSSLKGKPFDQGIYYFLMSSTRYVDKQYSTGAEYCALVPLIMSAFKKMHGIKYSEWDASEIHHIVDPKLLESITCDPPRYEVDDLLEFRVKGLTFASGARIGEKKNPVTTFGLTGLPKEFGKGAGPGALPKLTAMMLCQTWCAHPLNRNKYMILDPHDWDNIPEPLIVEDPIKGTTKLPEAVW